MAKRDLYQEITSEFLAALKEGTKPWVCPWTSGGSFAMPVNGTTGKPYSGMNVLLLAMRARSEGYRSNQWMTFQQGKAQGAFVRKGEKGTTCIFFKPMEKENRDTGETEKYAVLNAFTVFNREQFEGFEAPAQEPTWAPIEDAEAICQAFPIETRHGGDSAHYIPSLDRIHMPAREQFAKGEDYYATRLHEMVHATGHKSRLDRQLVGKFGSDAYAFEELVAELGSWMLCSRIGLQGDMQHKSYLAHWIRILDFDKKALFKAATLAQKAHDLCFEYLAQLESKKEDIAA